MKVLIAIFLMLGFMSLGISQHINWSQVRSGRISKKIISADTRNPTILTGRIFNGSIVSRIEDFPYQVGILTTNFQNQDVWCGASIISETYLLTAAHCLQGFNKAAIYAGVLNRKQPEPNSFIINVTHTNFITHEAYNPDDFFYNDIALIHLPIPIKFSERIKPIKLIRSKDANSFDHKIVIVSGWGDTSDLGNAPDNLQYTKSKILSKEWCQKHVDSLPLNLEFTVNTTSLICADPRDKTGICGGDSGGAAVIHVNGERIQIGVNSFGIHFEENPCESVLANAFLRITDYIPWICKHSNVCPS